jgi:hypothetical protein
MNLEDVQDHRDFICVRANESSLELARLNGETMPVNTKVLEKRLLGTAHEPRGTSKL